MSAPTMPAPLLPLSLCLACTLPSDNGCRCGEPDHLCDLRGRPRCPGCGRCAWCGHTDCATRDECHRRWRASETTWRELATPKPRRPTAVGGGW